MDSLGKLSQNQANTIDLPGLSYGLFHAVVAPMKTFGVVMSVTFPGVMMDIGHLRHLRVAKDNDTTTWINYNRMRGQQQSVLEASVPEQFFTDPAATTKPEGVSTVKALATAASQGQKIFTITQANIATALPQLQHSTSIIDEIRNAVAAGKEVTISERQVTVAGWTGAGYAIVDPATGAGAYLIEGGANGGYTGLGGLSIGLLGGISAVVAGPLIMGLVGAVGLAMTAMHFYYGDNRDNLDFASSRLVGLFSGVVLAIILTQTVLISFGPLFVIGTIILMMSTIRLLAMELFSILAFRYLRYGRVIA